jgi:PAS domain S-box-containing protein
MGQGSPLGTHILVRRATPWVAIAAVAALVIFITPLAWSALTTDVAIAILLGAVLVGVALAVVSRWRRARATASLTRRRLEELTEAERTLRTTLEAAGVGLALADLGGRFMQVNPALASILGRGREELARTSVVEVTAEQDRSSVADAIALIGRGDVARWEGQVIQDRADGVAVPVALYLTKLEGASASDGPMLLIQASDATANRRADALRDCAAAVRQIIAASPGLEPAMPELLTAFRKHLGWHEAHHWSARAEAVTAGDELAVRVWQAGVLAAEVDAERSAAAFPVIDAGEVVGVIELSSPSIKRLSDDEVSMLSRAGVEIGQFIRRTETAQALRRSEADHRAIFERSPIGIARIGGDGELLEANPSLLQMLGHDDDTMRTSAWPDMMRAYDQSAGRLGKPTFLAGITDGSSVQVRAATGAGNWRWLQLTATSIPDSTGRPEHVLLMIEDVTAVRETSDKLAEALEAQRAAIANLEKLDTTKSEFLSIVSHEFRTALTGIQGFSELIRDGGLEPDEVRAYGGYIFNDADRVNRLIGDMLDLDRMESGRMTMRAADVDVNDILMEAIARASTSTVTVEFKSDLDPRLPIVAGDRDRLIQVVSNLVNNAVKYSPEGGTVTLTSRVEGKYALISITDTGIGIPADEIGHVFERFRRVRSGAAQSIPGTGLGLTIVKQIVEMHGGKIWVESAVGHGSSFHFTIPLAPEGAAALQLRHG